MTNPEVLPPNPDLQDTLLRAGALTAPTSYLAPAERDVQRQLNAAYGSTARRRGKQAEARVCELLSDSLYWWITDVELAARCQEGYDVIAHLHPGSSLAHTLKTDLLRIEVKAGARVLEAYLKQKIRKLEWQQRFLTRCYFIVAAGEEWSDDEVHAQLAFQVLLWAGVLDDERKRWQVLRYLHHSHAHAFLEQEEATWETHWLFYQMIRARISAANSTEQN